MSGKKQWSSIYQQEEQGFRKTRSPRHLNLIYAEMSVRNCQGYDF